MNHTSTTTTNKQINKYLVFLANRANSKFSLEALFLDKRTFKDNFNNSLEVLELSNIKLFLKTNSLDCSYH